MYNSIQEKKNETKQRNNFSSHQKSNTNQQSFSEFIETAAKNGVVRVAISNVKFF